MKQKSLVWASFFMALTSSAMPAIIFSSFGPHGEGGVKNGQSLSIGAGGTVHELDAFLRVGSLDLNGPRPGVCAQLSGDPLPAGLSFGFSAATTNNAADLVLTYAFTNTTSSNFSDLRFFVLLDCEIDEWTNTFFNEYGAAYGQLGGGAGDADPDEWQIDEPGFQTGSLFRNLCFGALSNSNAIPVTTSNDVALALGFSLGSLKPGQTNLIRVMISETTNHLGKFWLIHRDHSPASTTLITLSGSATVNELPFGDVTPLVHMGFVRWQLNASAGSLLGTLAITNAAGTGATLGPPFQFGLQASPNFFLAHPAGVLANGLSYVDLTAALNAQVRDGTLGPGQSVVLTNAVEVYSLTRVPPPVTMFILEATSQ